MVFNTLTKIFLSPIYYIIHHNYIFGFFHKVFIKKFFYKNFSFNLKINEIPLQNYSSFLFKTYEYNDRKLIEKYIGKKNKCIVLGGGIGFIPTLVYAKSLRSILVFEINKKLISNLKKNLLNNGVVFKIFTKNLVFKKEKKKKYFFTDDFLSTSSKIKSTKKKLIENIELKKIKNFEKFNTLILDIEGDEDYYLLNIKKFKKIKYIFFELHYNIINKKVIKKIMSNLKNNGFNLKDKCFNSFYFSKI